MRITSTILGIIFSIAFAMQAFLASSVSNAVGDEATATAGAVGVVVALIWFISGALSYPVPLVSTILFGLSTLMVFGAASSGSYGDLYFWGGVGVLLTIVSFFGWRGKLKVDAKEAERDRLFAQMAASKV